MHQKLVLCVISLFTALLCHSAEDPKRELLQKIFPLVIGNIVRNYSLDHYDAIELSDHIMSYREIQNIIDKRAALVAQFSDEEYSQYLHYRFPRYVFCSPDTPAAAVLPAEFVTHDARILEECRNMCCLDPAKKDRLSAGPNSLGKHTMMQLPSARYDYPRAPYKTIIYIVSQEKLDQYQANGSWPVPLVHPNPEEEAEDSEAENS